MTNENNVHLLSDELRELADDLPRASSAAARDRARHTIARRARNRRAAVSGAAFAMVAVVGATVFIAVDGDKKNSQPPAGTTVPSVTSAPTTAPSSTSPPTQVIVTHVTVTVPAVADPAPAMYAKTFPWGTAADEVAFHTPQGEGASGGPMAFDADAAGNIVMLDQSNMRLVRFENGTASVVPLAMAGPAVTAAAFDDQGRVIIATLGDIAVFGPDGKAEGSWTGMTKDQYGIRRFEVDGNRVYFNNNAPYSTTSGSVVTRTLLLRDDGSGYVAVRDATPEPLPIQANVGQDAITVTVSGHPTSYRLVAGQQNDIRPIRLLPTGSLVFVITTPQSDSGASLDRSLTYVVGHIDRSGHATFSSVTASPGYTNGGPMFSISDAGLAVMGSTTTGGTTVSFYPLP